MRSESFKFKMGFLLFAFLAAMLFTRVKHSGGLLVEDLGDDCKDPLISGHDDQMFKFTATSISSKSVQPKLSDGWCPKVSDPYSDEYLQVDFRIKVNITAVATRGYMQSWVKTFHMYYSSDYYNWFNYKEPGEPYKSLLKANTDPETFVVHKIVKIVGARYLKIVPRLYEGSNCFRFEPFGCDGGMRNAIGLNEARIGPISGMSPMSDRSMWDTAYSYKSVDRTVGFSPGISGGYYIYYQVAFVGMHLLTGFLIQGCKTRPCPPVHTKVILRNATLDRYGYYNYGWDTITVFYAQSQREFPVKDILEKDSRGAVVHMFSEPVAAGEITLILYKYESSDYEDPCWRPPYKFCIQAEFYGIDLECKTPLGLEWSNHHPHGAVKDEQMTASSEDPSYPARVGRYKHTSAWCANKQMLEDPITAKSQYLQIDFLKLKSIAGILTQGLGRSSVVKRFYLYYATDPDAFHSFRHGENNEIVLLEGNEGLRRAHLNWLSHSIVARYIRVNPQHWIISPCLRVEVYGCNAECSSPVGMEYGMILNHQIRASSETTANKKDWGRLNSVGWCASVAVLQSGSVAPGKVLYHYLQIDLLKAHLIRGVATQGKQTQKPDNPDERPEAVTSFYLKYSFLGDEWFRYHKLLVGEYHANSVMRYWLEPPLVTRFVRFNPQSSWSPMHICMRVEVYGCSYKNYDECSSESFECHLHSKCVNIIGSYTCKCKRGFFSNGPYCLDFNECLSNRHDCDVNAWCTNTAGSYKCFCKEGYHGDGTSCEKGESP